MNIEDDFLPDPADEHAQRIAYLINGYIRKNLSTAEHQELDGWVTANVKNQILFEELTDPANISRWISWKEKLNTAGALEMVKEKTGMRKDTRNIARNRTRAFFIIAAAAILVLIFFVPKLYKSPKPSGNVEITTVQDLNPGGKHATLRLDNGAIILLDTVRSETINTAQNVQIIKDSLGLVYSPTVSVEEKFNELSTPAGGEYQVKLSDGTRVWLNASSWIRYPTTFSTSSRRVEIRGEAYFEVAKETNRPFIVQSGANVVKVLGTHFNVNAYEENRETIVTLSEGAVQLNGTSKLNPGEQGLIKSDGKIRIEPADLESTLAWKNGEFIFKMASLEQVMQQVSHWYDAKIIYKDNNNEHFNASIPRNVPVSKLLHLLEATGRVHFKIENKNIIVLN